MSSNVEKQGKIGRRRRSILKSRVSIDKKEFETIENEKGEECKNDLDSASSKNLRRVSKRISFSNHIHIKEISFNGNDGSTECEPGFNKTILETEDMEMSFFATECDEGSESQEKENSEGQACTITQVVNKSATHLLGNIDHSDYCASAAVERLEKSKTSERLKDAVLNAAETNKSQDRFCLVNKENLLNSKCHLEDMSLTSLSSDIKKIPPSPQSFIDASISKSNHPLHKQVELRNHGQNSQTIRNLRDLDQSSSFHPTARYASRADSNLLFPNTPLADLAVKSTFEDMSLTCLADGSIYQANHTVNKSRKDISVTSLEDASMRPENHTVGNTWKDMSLTCMGDASTYPANHTLRNTGKDMSLTCMRDASTYPANYTLRNTARDMSLTCMGDASINPENNIYRNAGRDMSLTRMGDASINPENHSLRSTGKDMSFTFIGDASINPENHSVRNTGKDMSFTCIGDASINPQIHSLRNSGKDMSLTRMGDASTNPENHIYRNAGRDMSLTCIGDASINPENHSVRNTGKDMSFTCIGDASINPQIHSLRNSGKDMSLTRIGDASINPENHSVRNTGKDMSLTCIGDASINPQIHSLRNSGKDMSLTRMEDASTNPENFNRTIRNTARDMSLTCIGDVSTYPTNPTFRNTERDMSLTCMGDASTYPTNSTLRNNARDMSVTCMGDASICPVKATVSNVTKTISTTLMEDGDSTTDGSNMSLSSPSDDATNPADILMDSTSDLKNIPLAVERADPTHNMRNSSKNAASMSIADDEVRSCEVEDSTIQNVKDMSFSRISDKSMYSIDNVRKNYLKQISSTRANHAANAMVYPDDRSERVTLKGTPPKCSNKVEVPLHNFGRKNFSEDITSKLDPRAINQTIDQADKTCFAIQQMSLDEENSPLQQFTLKNRKPVAPKLAIPVQRSETLDDQQPKKVVRDFHVPHNLLFQNRDRFKLKPKRKIFRRNAFMGKVSNTFLKDPFACQSSLEQFFAYMSPKSSDMRKYLLTRQKNAVSCEVQTSPWLLKKDSSSVCKVITKDSSCSTSCVVKTVDISCNTTEYNEPSPKAYDLQVISSNPVSESESIHITKKQIKPHNMLQNISNPPKCTDILSPVSTKVEDMSRINHRSYVKVPFKELYISQEPSLSSTNPLYNRTQEFSTAPGHSDLEISSENPSKIPVSSRRQAILSGVADNSKPCKKSVVVDASDRQCKSQIIDFGNRQDSSHIIDACNRQDNSHVINAIIQQDKTQVIDGSSRQDKSQVIDGSSRQDKSQVIDACNRQDESQVIDFGNRQDSSHVINASNQQDKSQVIDGSSRQDESKVVDASNRQYKSQVIDFGNGQDNSHVINASNQQYKSQVIDGSRRQDKFQDIEVNNQQNKSVIVADTSSIMRSKKESGFLNANALGATGSTCERSPSERILRCSELSRTTMNPRNKDLSGSKVHRDHQSHDSSASSKLLPNNENVVFNQTFVVRTREYNTTKFKDLENGTGHSNIIEEGGNSMPKDVSQHMADSPSCTDISIARLSNSTWHLETEKFSCNKSVSEERSEQLNFTDGIVDTDLSVQLVSSLFLDSDDSENATNFKLAASETESQNDDLEGIIGLYARRLTTCRGVKLIQVLKELKERLVQLPEEEFQQAISLACSKNLLCTKYAKAIEMIRENMATRQKHCLQLQVKD